MTVDIATLGIKVDSQAVKQADNDLAKLAKTGEVAEHSTRGVTSATEELAERVARLKASVDPLGLAQSKVNAEMAEAETLYARGAISAADYSQAQMVLAARAEVLRETQERSNTMLHRGAASAKLAGHEMLNLGRQFSDVGVQLAMGMNPLMILVQQGPQIADVLTVAGQRGVTAGAAFRQMGVSLWTALAPALPIIAAVAAGVAVVGGAFALFAHEANKSAGDVQRSLGLTETQMKRLKDAGVDTSVTMKDAFLGFFDTIKDRLVAAFGPQIEWVKDKFGDLYQLVKDGAVWSIKAVVGTFVGGYNAIKVAWGMLPAALSDIAVSAANGVIAIIERMVNAVIARINTVAQFANQAATSVGMNAPFGELSEVAIGRINNPNAGAANRTAGAVAGAFREGYAQGGAAVDDFAEDWQRNTINRRNRRVLDAAGDAGGSGAGDGRERGAANDNAAKEAEDFARALREETAEIGKNRVELKMMAVERAAAAAPTARLASEIRAAGQAWREATNANATNELRRELQDVADATAFENRLLGMNARERAVANAEREIELRLRAYQRQGIDIDTAAIQAETDAIRANAAARGERELNVENARAYTEQLRSMNDALREGVQGFGQLFGTAGAGFEALINTMTNYADRRAELQEQIATADERTAEGQRQRESATAELARAEVGYYGDMLGAAKRLFKEKSAGYRVLEAIEKAYRAYQMASLILETIGVTKSIALDGAKTASSVANSGIRASADGVAAIAKAIASLPFPLNLVAGAATAAALVAFGVKVFGGKGGGGASATSEAESKQPVYSGARDEYGNPTSSYSVLKPGATVANDNGTIAPAPGVRAGQNVGSTVNSTASYQINIEGNADAGTVAQLQAALDAHEERVVARATQAAAQDAAARAGRQRIGGAG
jgi:hypothetical protein